MVLVVRHIKVRQFGFAEFKLHVALFRNQSRVIDSLRRKGEQLTHFLFGFQIKFVCAEFKPRVLIYRVVRLNAN